MKTTLFILALFVALPAVAPAAETELKDQKDKVSYSIGLDIGTTLKRQLIDVNEEMLNKGIQDGMKGNKALLTEEQMKETMANFQKEMQAKQAAAKKESAEKNSDEGKKFLVENKSKDGVKTTASGLQYKVLKAGSGETPKPTDTVKVNYRGTTIDGTEFDSSYKRGQPASFPVNRVIKGWTEALQLMKPGAKYQLFVPEDLAYGERGAGADIGPNATLLFDVELLEIVPEAKAAAATDTEADATAPAGSAAPPRGSSGPAVKPAMSPAASAPAAPATTPTTSAASPSPAKP